jgi:hypothetical protein
MANQRTSAREAVGVETKVARVTGELRERECVLLHGSLERAVKAVKAYGTAVRG